MCEKNGWESKVKTIPLPSPHTVRGSHRWRRETSWQKSWWHMYSPGGWFVPHRHLFCSWEIDRYLITYFQSWGAETANKQNLSVPDRALRWKPSERRTPLKAIPMEFSASPLCTSTLYPRMSLTTIPKSAVSDLFVRVTGKLRWILLALGALSSDQVW